MVRHASAVSVIAQRPRVVAAAYETFFLTWRDPCHAVIALSDGHLGLPEVRSADFDSRLYRSKQSQRISSANQKRFELGWLMVLILDSIEVSSVSELPI